MIRRYTIIIAFLFIAVIAYEVVGAIRQSTPASPAEIRTAIATAPKPCRDLVRARLHAMIATRDTISRRNLSFAVQRDCGIAAEQLRAVDNPLGPGRSHAASGKQFSNRILFQ